MKCSNCGTENNSDALFCVSCGNKLNSETSSVNNTTSDVLSQDSTATSKTNEQSNTTTFDAQIPRSYVDNNVQTITMNGSTQKNKPKSKWLTIGLPIVIGIVVLILIGSLGGNSAQQRLGEYLESIGFTRNSSTNYTRYVEGYLYTFDFEEALLSQESSTIYDAYFYKENMFGTAMVSDDLTLVATYDYSTNSYGCETDPVRYQSYICSNMKYSIIELASAAKQTFFDIINEAGVSVSDL